MECRAVCSFEKGYVRMLNYIGTKTIETERMILRRFEYSDNDSMRRNWISNEKIQTLYSEPVYVTQEEVKELLDKYICSYDKEDYYRWAIFLHGWAVCGQIILLNT